MDFNFFISLAQSYWYAGIFMIGLLSSATIFLPTPAFAVIFFLAGAHAFDPLALGIVAGAGAAVGELTGYVLGYGAHRFALKKRYAKLIKRTEKYFQKYGAPVIIFVFAATPLPFDIVGLFCGAVKYPWQKFFTATLAGKIVKYIFIAYAGFYGIGWAKSLFGL
jgi:membrane protein YqaA with SNARE-associated domain